jgi:hypothetical protein
VSAIQTLIDRGLSLRKQIELLTADLERCEADIIHLAKEGEHVPLADEDREGKQYLAHGSNVTVPVIFTADKLIASFKDGGAVHDLIVLAIGDKPLAPFYRPQTTWEAVPNDGKAFRKAADELLGIKGPGFVTACKSRDKFGVPKSDIKIEWKQANEK